MDTPAIITGKRMHPIIGFIILVIAIVVAIHAADALDRVISKWRVAKEVDNNKVVADAQGASVNNPTGVK